MSRRGRRGVDMKQPGVGRTRCAPPFVTARRHLRVRAGASLPSQRVVTAFQLQTTHHLRISGAQAWSLHTVHVTVSLNNSRLFACVDCYA
jgi:hypothetical protein